MAIIFKLFFFSFSKVITNFKSLIFLLIAGAAIYNAYFLSLTFPISQTTFSILTVVFCFFSFLLYFIPSIKKLERIVFKFYPINGVKRYCINLTYSTIFTKDFLFTLIFIVFFTIFAHLKDYYLFITFFVFISITYILRRGLQVLMFSYFTIRKIPFFVYTAFLLSSILYLTIFYINNNHLILPFGVQIILLTLTMIVGYLVEEIFSEYNQTITKANKVSKSIYLDLFLKNEKFRIYFWGSVVVKSIFLILMTILFYQKNKYLPIFFIILFSSPIILFNYTLNNTFGFYSTFWSSINKCNNNGLEVFKIYLKLLKFPIIIDFVITTMFAIVNIPLFGIIISSYFLSIIPLIVLSFYWSMLLPLKVEPTLFSAKSTSSFFASMITFGICISFITLNISKWYALIGLLYIFLSITLIYNVNSLYENSKSKFYKKMYK